MNNLRIVYIIININNVFLINLKWAENARTQFSTDRNFAAWLPKRATIGYYSQL